MSIVLALPKLYDDVVARFTVDAEALDAEPVLQVFGWREPAKRPDAQQRIVWVPGDDAGSAGEISDARYPGRNPRPLSTLREAFTVFVEASAAPLENERAQYQAARELFDAWFRAVYLAAHGTFEISKVEWVDTKLERRFGATLRVVGTVDAMIPDAPWAVTEEGLGADIDAEELDHEESILVPAAP